MSMILDSQGLSPSTAAAVGDVTSCEQLPVGPDSRSPLRVPRPDDPELIALVTRGRAGDMTAQSELIRRYRPRLAGFVRPMIRDPETVKDVVQTISAKVVRRLPGLRDASVFEAWLFTLARNTVRDHQRSARCRPVLFDHEDALRDVPDPVAEDRSREILEAVEGALRDTSPMNRRILHQIISGASYQQVARAEGISLSALKVRVHRMRQELRQRAGWALGNLFSRKRVSRVALP